MRFALALVLCACSLPDGEWFGRVPTPDPTHFTWCNAGEPEYIDPAMASSTTDIKIVYELFDGLTTFDANALPEPSLAESWDISPDLTRFTFHLRPDAVWSNGRPITSADFAYSYARVLHPTTASTNADTLWRLVNGEAYNAGLARLVIRDSGPFKTGDVVKAKEGAKDSNLRVPRAKIALRADASSAAEVWGSAPAGAELTIIDVGGPGCPGTLGARDVASCDWAYVDYPDGDGLFGWVPLAALDAPNDGETITLDDGRTIAARDVLMVPDLLGIRTPDPLTLVLTLHDPMPYFLQMTLNREMRPAPREVVSRWPRRWTKPEHIVTSGPFDLREWRERDKFELVKSKTFWGRATVRLERVTILSMNDQSANANVYYQGGCDAVVSNNVPTTYIPLLEKKKDYVRAPFLGVYFYLVNVKHFPNVHFRRALSFALDRTKLPILLKGGQIPTAAFVPGKPIAQLTDAERALCGVTADQKGVALIVEKDKLCYVPAVGPDFDPARAKEELALAKKEMGGSFPSKVTVRFNTGVESHKTIAEWVQAEWEKNLGMDVELESQEWKTFLKATVNGEYDVARFGEIGNITDPEAEFLQMFRCTNPDNRTGWCNPQYDALYQQAEKEPDRAKRLALIHQADQLMIDDAPVLPMYVYTQHVLMKPYMRDLFVNLVDHQALRDTWIDPDWGKKK